MPYRIDDPLMLDTLPFAIRIVCTTHILILVCTILIDYLSATEQEMRANLAFIIQSAVEIPLILLLEKWTGMNSPWYAALISQCVVLIYLLGFCDHLYKGILFFHRENLLLLCGGKLGDGFAEEIERGSMNILTEKQLALVRDQMITPLLNAVSGKASPVSTFTILKREDGRLAAVLRYKAKKDYLDTEPDIYDTGEGEEDAPIPSDTCIRSEFIGMWRMMILMER